MIPYGKEKEGKVYKKDNRRWVEGQVWEENVWVASCLDGNSEARLFSFHWSIHDYALSSNLCFPSPISTSKLRSNTCMHAYFVPSGSLACTHFHSSSSTFRAYEREYVRTYKRARERKYLDKAFKERQRWRDTYLIL